MNKLKITELSQVNGGANTPERRMGIAIIGIFSSTLGMGLFIANLFD